MGILSFKTRNLKSGSVSKKKAAYVSDAKNERYNQRETPGIEHHDARGFMIDLISGFRECRAIESREDERVSTRKAVEYRFEKSRMRMRGRRVVA